MKILQIIGVLNRGGAETLLMNVFRNIDRNEFEFDFLIFEDKEFPYTKEIKNMGGNVIYLPGPQKIGMIKFIKELINLCKKNKYDVVHAHTLFNCGPCMLAAYLAKIKIRIAHSHNTKILDKKINAKKKIYFIIAKLLLNIFSNFKIACGKEAGKFLFYKFNKYIVLKNGVDIKKFEFNNKYRKEIRKLYNIKEDNFVIGNIGRLNYAKNQEFLIELFKKINEIEKNAFLFIIGDGNLYKTLTDKVKENNLEERVIFTGNIDNVNQYYSAFDIFLFPSLFEGLPLTLIEAQCNGLPIIASNSISKECNITNTICFQSLDNKEEWIKLILELKNKKRYYNEPKILNSGYDIKETVKKLENIYKGEKNVY